uniref:ATP-dependent RNA helicase n=1 Tax=Bombyx mori TaxID=7091 RepID=A0A8R2QY29_BOMMO|nr:probable ATP-dependent RNA helicase pitchoune isoform X3 [Bombyx mori]
MESKKLPKFKELKEQLSAATLNAIREMGFKRMTEIQAEVLPSALDGNDIVATAKTGSGKTLAFLIPVIEVVAKNIEKAMHGTFSIIIAPTRELAIQTYSVLQELINHHNKITSTLVIGGESRKKQSSDLVQGMHIVVATPGRLFDHMRTKEFDYKCVKCLVLDEADKIFQYGFEEDLKQIINRLPKDRQTMLFSATLSERTDALVESAMKKDKIQHINTDQDDLCATVEGLKQGYAVCQTQYRLWWLHKVLKKTKQFKVMGKMNQTDRTATINIFYETENIALFCTDVAARGLDIPAVDWIVQFDPPGDANEYIHRVGRTARGLGADGNAVLLLRPEEVGFVDYLKESKIYVDKYESWDSYYNLQKKLDTAMSDSNFVNLAIEAFEGYVRALEVRKLKQIFNLLTMDLDVLARSFGLKEKPDVDIRIGFSKKHRPRKRMAAILASQSDTKKAKS